MRPHFRYKKRKALLDKFEISVVCQAEKEDYGKHFLELTKQATTIH